MSDEPDGLEEKLERARESMRALTKGWNRDEIEQIVEFLQTLNSTQTGR